MAVVLALCADAVFGTGVALQQRVAAAAPDHAALRPSFLTRLARDPRWLVGLGVEVGGFALHAAALAGGSLTLVQPLLTLDLVFTLAIASVWARSPLSPRDWAGVLLTVGGIALFLVVSSPTTDSTARASAEAWLACGLAVAVPVAALAAAATRASGVHRSALLALAGGAANGFMAVVTKAFADRAGHGVPVLLRSWQPYVLVAAGLLALLVVQSAYQTGHPAVVLPTMNVVDPVVSVLVGAALFGETFHAGRPAVPLAVAVALAGLAMLGANPLVDGRERPLGAST